jgi:hypothetical protein
MKILIRWISPLLICGLILVSYRDASLIKKGKHVKTCAAPLKDPSACQSLSGKMGEESFSFFRDVISNIAPALKNLK